MPVSGESIELDKVHLVADGDKVTVGNPLISGAKVIADVVGDGRQDKIIVFKYKPKKRIRTTTGHRQWYTELEIDKIVAK